MYITKINLINFKNYAETDLNFSSQINIFVGPNGAGKTNLLDAIYCLSLTKSAFAASEQQSVRHKETFFSILGHFSKNAEISAVQYDFAGGKKNFKLNKNPYDKLSHHIGSFPVVLVTPYDTDVIREGSEERRKFFDTILSQIDNTYLTELIQYTNILKQRNSLLKQFAETNKIDRELVDSYDVPLLLLAKHIYEKRMLFIKEFVPIFNAHYLNLSDDREQPGLLYKSDLQEQDFEKKFRSNFQRDLLLQRTSLGTHRDDYEFTLSNYALKNYGSQGQQKSFVIALKLAHFEIIKKQKSLKPILLLDDIFDKLDDRRIEKLMQMVAEEAFGQLFITDARPERTSKVFEEIKAEVRIFLIEDGKVLPYTKQG